MSTLLIISMQWLFFVVILVRRNIIPPMDPESPESADSKSTLGPLGLSLGSRCRSDILRGLQH